MVSYADLKGMFEITAFTPEGNEYFKEVEGKPSEIGDMCIELENAGYEEVEAIVSLTGMTYWIDGYTLEDAFDISDDGIVE